MSCESQQSNGIKCINLISWYLYTQSADTLKLCLYVFVCIYLNLYLYITHIALYSITHISYPLTPSVRGHIRPSIFLFCLHLCWPKTSIFVFGEPAENPKGNQHKPQSPGAAVRMLKVTGRAVTCGERGQAVCFLNEVCDTFVPIKMWL